MGHHATTGQQPGRSKEVLRGPVGEAVVDARSPVPECGPAALAVLAESGRPMVVAEGPEDIDPPIALGLAAGNAVVLANISVHADD
eukprot:8185634-Alexandrium_andersonii.AAC.1